MSDIEKARQVFEKAGLAFPTIPEKLAEQLKEQSEWVFSTRPIDEWPYFLHSYVEEAEKSEVDDYVVLCHAGHGVNSYAIHYYLVQGSLRMFLQLAWGGVYSDGNEDAALIRDCFSLADKIASAAKTVGPFQAGTHLTIVVSNFSGSYWLPPGKIRREEASGDEATLKVLTQALNWLKRRQTKMRREVRKIDPTLELGLHELSNSGTGRCRPDSFFSFQLEFAMTQAKDILDNLGSLAENTIKKAPVRAKDKDFKLCREPNPTREFRHEEVNWERAMHEKWGPKGSGSFLPTCRRIQTYQYPLKATSKDKCWGEIDLLGVGKDGLPVPIELKKARTYDSPLRMVVEVAAYGFAIQKVWPNLREHWAKALSVNQSHLPEKLESVTLVCVAPDEYWCSCTGRPGKSRRAFPTEAWPLFWELVDAFKKKGVDIHFAVVEGTPDNITGAQELDREWFSLKLAACNPNPR